MKKNLRIKFKIIFLINICFLSFLYYVNSIQIKNVESKTENFEADDYKFNDLYLSGTLNEEFYVESFENFRMIEITNFLEGLLKKQENIFFIFCFNATFLICEFCGIFKNISINKKSRDSNSLEIEGIEVTEEEMKVFNLIQEFLNQNRVFNRESVVSYIKSRSRTNGNLNYNGIKSVIASLVKKNIIIEGSKFTRKTVLLNSNREIIYNMIREYPGIYMNKLSKILKLSPFVVNWHLSILMKFNLIRKQNLNNNISYFTSSLNKQNDMVFQIISREKCVKIIRFLNKNKRGYTKNQIAKLLHMHYNTIIKYLNEIDKFNLLIIKKCENKEYLFLNIDNYDNLTKNE